MCDCRKAVDERLSVSNARIAFGFTISGGRRDLSPPMIVLEKLDDKKRGKLPSLLATFCPFCGERYEPKQREAQS
jgi:hypothetical protein